MSDQASEAVAPKPGRPSTYSLEVATDICVRIASGEKVSDICLEDSMPSPSTVYLWLVKHSEFSEQYAKAQADRTHAMAEELLDIADDGTNDWMERHHGEDTAWVTNGEALQRSRLRVDTRKWLMSKMLPKKYGDKTVIEGGDPDKPVNVLQKVERFIVDPAA